MSSQEVVPPTTWAHARERSNAATLRLMSWIATTLGRRVARLVLHPIALYFLLLGGAASRASADYLQRVLGRRPRWRERYAHIHHFAATVLDRVYLLRDQLDEFQFRVTGIELLDDLLQRGQGVLLVGAHLGSFEALRALGQSHPGARVAMVMYEDNARLINQTLRALAPQAELHTIALGRLQAMLDLRQWLDDGGVAGVLADRSLPVQSQRSALHRLPFLGQDAAFSDGPFRLAALLRRPVLFMTGLYHGGASYELRFSALADFSALAGGRGADRSAMDAAVEQAMRAYAAQVEALCRETPYNWFNFFDFWAPSATASASAPPVPSSPSGHGAGLHERHKHV
jgi:predicted LPLAT superfamily acyltransferase